MTISKAKTEEILNKNLHYTVVCTEIINIIARKYGAETLAIFTFLLNQAANFDIRKSYICRTLKLSERAFQRAMQNLQELQLSYLVPGERNSNGTLKGKTWHVYGLPREITQQLDEFFQRNADYLKTAPSVAPGDAPPEPAPDGFFDNEAQKRADAAVVRPSVNCAYLTSYQLNKTSNKLKTSDKYAQNEFARFYAQYPRKRDRARAYRVFLQLIKGKSQEEITTLVNKCIANVNARIRSGEWNDIDYIPYAKVYLNPDNEAWNEIIYTDQSATRLGIEGGKTIDEIFNVDVEEKFDDIVIVNTYECDVYNKKKDGLNTKTHLNH